MYRNPRLTGKILAGPFSLPDSLENLGDPGIHIIIKSKIIVKR